MESLPWPLIGYGSGWACFAALGFLILRKVANGDWIPRSSHERELFRAEHEANEWRAEGRIKDQAILVELESIKLTGEEHLRTTTSLAAGIQKAGGITGSPT